MALVSRADGRRVFVLGVAGLIPAALVTLLLVHQPSIGRRRLYPLLRGSLVVAGLFLAIATLVVWVMESRRASRASLTGIAWAALAGLLCIGPLLESTPRARLYALALDDGEVAWIWKRAVTAPHLVGGDLVVTDIGSEDLIGLDPATGDERWRHSASVGDAQMLVTVESASGPRIAHGSIHAAVDEAPWTLSWPGDTVLAVTRSGGDGYAYVSTPGADGSSGGAIVRFDLADGRVRWRVALPDSLVAVNGAPAIGASGDTVVVAGGQRVAALAADDGQVRWSQSIASLGKSRGFVLPGSVQQVIATGEMVYLLATPQG